MPWTLLAGGTFNGLNPATLAAVVGNPPSRFYLSGDGHRTPPFQWAVRPAVLLHFQTLMAAGNLCLHVEQLQEDVSSDSLPPLFARLIQQKMVFGWELSMFKDLLPVMNLCMDLMGQLPNPSLNEVVALHREMIRIDGLGWKVGNPPWMHAAVAQSDIFKTYWSGVASKTTPRNNATQDNYLTFLAQYNNNAMGLRTDANNFIAVNINRVIAAHPNATHLITVGNAHITTNPVQQYINLGTEVGLVDPSQG